MKKLFFPIITLALLIGGGQGVYTAMQNKQPTTYSINAINSNNMPKEKWLTLTNCNFNLTESVYFESALGNGLAKEIYTPLHSENDSIVVFVAQKTQGLLDVFNLINTQTDIDKRNHYITKYKDQIFQENLTYSGVVRYGIDLDNKQWRQLSQTSNLVAKNFLILDYNTKPSSGMSYFMLGVGVIFAFISIKRLFGKNTENEIPQN